MSDNTSFFLLSGARSQAREEARRRSSRSRTVGLSIAFGSLFLVSAGGLAVAFLPALNRGGDRKAPAAVALPKTQNTPLEDEQNAEYFKKLTAEQYHVTREKGTERPFTGKYLEHKEDGVYKCVCCGTTLFDSADKFDSRTGWPSFTRPVEESNIKTAIDLSMFTTRTEVICRKCNAHLGHEFDDGIKPTGLRYCINSASLDFQKRPAGTRAGH